MLEDFFKGGSVVMGLALGIGAIVLAPVLVPALRPLAKNVIKAGFLGVHEAQIALAELAETAEDIFAEARAEMTETTNGAVRAGAKPRSAGRKRTVIARRPRKNLAADQLVSR